ncbi:MAG TPA: sigma-E factor negative regulatory protein [Gammaproteobacteria bacterium]|nr:sigma-E factor negative regulatory protein [Gammaproteobacteria bacterium]
MTEKYAEKISMLMDDELNDHEAANLIQGIEHDEWLKQCWERYHLIGDALKNNLPGMVQHDLAGRVSEALSAEQVYHLPPIKKPRSTPSFMKPAVGLALAASLAAVAVMVVPWHNGAVTAGEGQPQASLAAPTQGGGLAMGGQMVSDRVAAEQLPVQQAAVSQPTTPAGGREVKVEPVLYDYLLDHNEYTDAASVQSTMLPYVRIVGYSSGAKGDHR